MQIRLGNRTDEPVIQKLVARVMTEFALQFDLNGAESDLKNVDANYFAHNGVFLVAEQEGELIGIAGARAETETDLELVRIAVDKKCRGTGVARKLMSTVISFANDLEYKRIVVEPARQYPGGNDFLMRFDFTSAPLEDAQVQWYLELENPNR